MKRFSFNRVVAISLLTLAASEAGYLPEPTRADHGNSVYQGVSPVPTEGPFLMELGEQLEDQQDLRKLAARQGPGVCAYVSGIQAYSLTCSPGMSCSINSNRAAGCCLPGNSCPMPTSCIPYMSLGYCNGPCANDPLVLKCANPIAPYCYTLEIDYKTANYYQLNCFSQPGILTASYTYSNAVRPASVTPVSVSIPPVVAQSSGVVGNQNNNQNNNNININVGGQQSVQSGGGNGGGSSANNNNGGGSTAKSSDGSRQKLSWPLQSCVVVVSFLFYSF